MTRTQALSIRAAMDAAGSHLTDGQAAEATAMYRPWKPDEDYAAGDMRRHGEYLYRVRQSHTSQAIYPPPLVPSLWERVQEQGQGTHDNPIPYDAAVGMALETGLYYTEGDVLYECIRDTGVPVYNRLADLVGIYVNVSN